MPNNETANVAAPTAKPEAKASKAKPAAKAAKPGAKRNVTLRSGTTGQRAGTHVSPNAKAAKASSKPASGKPEAAKPSGAVNRTAATIAADRTNFGGTVSDRDEAYLRFYAGLAKRATGGRVTLADIVASGKRPSYDGSNKPHDAGVINRLAKAGLVAKASDGHSFTFTKRGTEHRAYARA